MNQFCHQILIFKGVQLKRVHPEAILCGCQDVKVEELNNQMLEWIPLWDDPKLALNISRESQPDGRLDSQFLKWRQLKVSHRTVRA